MEMAWQEFLAPCIAADLVEAEHRHLPVEKRILERFRHQRPGQLLEAAAEFFRAGRLARCAFAGQQRHDEIEGLLFLGIERRFDFCRRLGDQPGVVFGKRAFGAVGAIDREDAEQRLQRGGDRRLADIDMGFLRQRQLDRQPFQAGTLAGEIARDHRLTGAVQAGGDIGEAAQRRILAAQPLRALALDQQMGHPVDEFVAGGAGDRPVGRQILAIFQDFFDDQIGLVADVPAQPGEIGGGIGKSIDMVDAQSLHLAIAHQLEDQPVAVLENPVILDIDADQLRHLEKAAIAQAFRRFAPVNELEMLAFVHVFEMSGILRQRRKPVLQPRPVGLVGQQGAQARVKPVLALAPRDVGK